MSKTFILSDESVNDRGTRIITAGINLDRFKKNPIMLYMHRRDDGWDYEGIRPIGVWENIRKKDGQLLAEPKFDENDSFAKLIESKVENDFLKGASIGINPIAFSEDEKDLEKGQTRATITKCEIYEASIVDMPSNKNTVSLMANNRNEDAIPLLKSNTNMAENDNKKLTFKNEAELITFIKERFGMEPKAAEPKEEPKEEATFSFKSEEDARNWFHKLFGLKPKAKPEVNEDPTEENNSVLESEEYKALKSERDQLKQQNENLKGAPGATTSKTTNPTDGGEGGEDNDNFSTYASAKKDWDAIGEVFDE